MNLVPCQSMYPVLLGKPIDKIILVFIYSLDEVRRSPLCKVFHFARCIEYTHKRTSYFIRNDP